MNKLLVLFCVIVLSQAALGQQTVEYESKLILDPFTFASTPLLIITSDVQAGGNGTRDQVFESNLDSSIFGGERDLNLRVLFSEDNLVLSTNVNNGFFSASTPNGPNGNAVLTLDGIDNSTQVNRQGLNNLAQSNFIGLGATAFRYIVATDQPTDVVLKVYQRIAGVDKICQRVNSIPGGDVEVAVIVDFTEFTDPVDGGVCEIPFTRIGAVEMSLVMKTAVDINIRDWGLWGPVVTCNCFCPTYTCRIELDLDDDEYFYYRSSDFNEGSINNPTTDFSTVNPGSTRTATPTRGLTPTRTPVRDPGTSGSPVTVTNGTPSTNVIISNNNNDSASDASVIALAGALIFVVAALF